MTINPIPKALDSSGTIMKQGITEWHPQESKILKSYAEIAGSYRWMHNMTYGIYRRKNLWYMIPIIIISTITGTASFSLSAFPPNVRDYVPFIIGLLNLIAGLLTTIYNFLKISECMESHRIASINYGKLCRSVTVILNVPLKNRETSGAETVKSSRAEIDRLIEQSPPIPSGVIKAYKEIIDPEHNELTEPDIIKVSKVDVYVDIDAQVNAKIAEAATLFKNLKKPPPPKPNVFESNVSQSPVKRKQEEIREELNEVSNTKIVSNIDKAVLAKSMTIGALKSRLGIIGKSVIPKPIPEHEPIQEPVELTEVVVELSEPIPEPESVEPVLDSESESETEVKEVVADLVESVVAESEPPPVVVPQPVPLTAQRQTIDSELEQLRQSGLVQNKK